MPNELHYKKLENMYLSAKINETANYQIQISERKSEITVEANSDMYHAAGAVHSSIYFKLLDDAAYFASASITDDVYLLTTTFSTNILRPINKGELRAVGKLVFASKHLFIAEAVVYDKTGTVLAFGTGNFAKSKMPLSEQIGYWTDVQDENPAEEEGEKDFDPPYDPNVTGNKLYGDDL